jgi:hypothetical protein
MKRVIPTVIIMIFLLSFTMPVTAAATSVQAIPTFTILDVVKDQSVTIQTANFPPNDTFIVSMGAYGTLGIDGMVVGTTNSGNGGSFTQTFNIPSALVGSTRIAIRLQSPTSGYFAFNWFWNNTAAINPSPTPSSSPTPTTSGYSGFPTFFIESVVADKSVTISGVNFPANDKFEVLMGAYGTRGIDGTNVGSTNSGAGGNLSATYNIPSSLAGSTRIAIRLQSPTSGYFAYNWFWNNTTSP